MSEITMNNEISSVVGLVESYLRLKNFKNKRNHEVYHPSAFGRCLRLMQYQRYEERGLIKTSPQVKTGQQLRLFANGDGMHDRWKKYFEELGVLRGVWKCKNILCRMYDDSGQKINDINESDIYSNPEKYNSREYGKKDLQGIFKPEKCSCGCNKFHYEEVSVHDEELNFHGHADIILDFSRFDASIFEESKKNGIGVFFEENKLPKGIVVVDMKTCGTNQFQNVVKKTGYHKYYGIQLTIYVHILKCDYGMLIYEEKDQFDLAAFKINPNPTAWEQIRSQAILMSKMADSGKNLLPPPRPISKSSYECKDCPFREHCHRSGGVWDDPKLEQKRRDFYGELL